MNATADLQNQLDCTTPGMAVPPEPTLPVTAIQGDYVKYIVLSKGKYIKIVDFGDYSTMEYNSIKNGMDKQIPVSDFLSELETLIAEARKMQASQQ